MNPLLNFMFYLYETLETLTKMEILPKLLEIFSQTLDKQGNEPCFNGKQFAALFCFSELSRSCFQTSTNRA